MTRDAIEKRQGNRLKQARRDAHYRSAREAALANEWPESTYRAHEAGTRTMGRNDAEAYARIFRARGAKVTAREIIFPEDPVDGFETVAYERGWDDAMASITRTATAPRPSPEPPKAIRRTR